MICQGYTIARTVLVPTWQSITHYNSFSNIYRCLQWTSTVSEMIYPYMFQLFPINHRDFHCQPYQRATFGIRSGQGEKFVLFAKGFWTIGWVYFKIKRWDQIIQNEMLFTKETYRLQSAYSDFSPIITNPWADWILHHISFPGKGADAGKTQWKPSATWCKMGLQNQVLEGFSTRKDIRLIEDEILDYIYIYTHICIYIYIRYSNSLCTYQPTENFSLEGFLQV